MKLSTLNYIVYIKMPILCTLFAFILINIGVPSEAFENVEFVQELKAGLTDPIDVDLSDSGRIYILNQKTSEVIIFDDQGKIKTIFGSKGSEPGEMKRPTSLALTPKEEIVVADTGNNRIQVFNQHGEYLFQFGDFGSKTGQFNSPEGVVVDASGFIYVADTNNTRLQSFTSRGVYIGSLATESKPVDIALDVQRNIYVLMPEVGKIVQYSPKGQKLDEIVSKREGRNFIKQATRIVIDRRGDIYVAESAEHSVKKIDDTEDLLLSFGSEGEGRGQFDQPRGMAVDIKDHVYVADSENQRVQIFQISGSKKSFLSMAEFFPHLVNFNSYIFSERSIVDVNYIEGKGLYALSDRNAHIKFTGTPHRMFGSVGRDPGKFSTPMALHVAKDGTMYVADTGNDRLQVISDDGTPVFEFGKSGFKTGQFDDPRGVAVNSKGIIYVADTQNDRIQIFNKDGIFLSAFGFTTINKGDSKAQKGSFNEPTSLAVDSKDRLFVVDQGNDRIQIFDENGNYLDEIGEEGTHTTQFQTPVDIAIDENDYLYVADQGNNRIQIFDSKNNFVVSFGSYGEGPGYFPQLSGISVAKGKIYISDYDLETIKVFNFNVDKVAQYLRKEVVQNQNKKEKEAVKVAKPKVTKAVQKEQDEDIVQVTKLVQEIEKADVAPPPQIEEKAVEQKVEQKTASAKKALGKERAERIYVTKTFYLPPNYENSNESVKLQVRLLTQDEAMNELAQKVGVEKTELVAHTKIESEEITEKGEFRLTLSAPKKIPIQ